MARLVFFIALALLIASAAAVTDAREWLKQNEHRARDLLESDPDNVWAKSVLLFNNDPDGYAEWLEETFGGPVTHLVYVGALAAIVSGWGGGRVVAQRQAGA